MLFLDCFDVLDVTEIELVDYVAHVQGFDLLVDHQPGEDVLVGVRTDMKITRHLFDSE